MTSPGVEAAEALLLERLVRGSSWLLRVLAAVHESGLPDAMVGAGVLRDLVWGHLHDGFEPGEVKDVDVAYFDPADLRPERDAAAEERLRRLLPTVPWEARNQAAVHTWYAGRFGGTPYSPVGSTCEAIGRWPETATSVGVRLDGAGRLDVCAPVGLSDLLGGVWRRNPRQVSLEESVRRLRKHRVGERWPRVRVIPPDGGTGEADRGRAAPGGSRRDASEMRLPSPGPVQGTRLGGGA